MVRADVAAAARELAAREPVIAGLLERHGPPQIPRPRPTGERFPALARSVLYQQLAGSAAAAIHRRVVDAAGGSLAPAPLVALGFDGLRACGVSSAKAVSLLDLSVRVGTGEIRLERIGRLADHEVVEHLTRVRGIGTWTAEMFLLFTLGRLDVWPVGDFGVRAGYGAAWGLGGPPTPGALTGHGDPYRPYRSIVAWYCWRAADEAKRARLAS